MEEVPTQPEEVIQIEVAPEEEMMPPTFEVPLESCQATDGEELRLNCKVAGRPPPQIMWFHNEENIDQHDEYVISYNPDIGEISLIIVEVFPEDEGQYTCYAINPAGETTTTCMLTVVVPEEPETPIETEEEIMTAEVQVEPVTPVQTETELQPETQVQAEFEIQQPEKAEIEVVARPETNVEAAFEIQQDIPLQDDTTAQTEVVELEIQPEIKDLKKEILVEIQPETKVEEDLFIQSEIPVEVVDSQEGTHVQEQFEIQIDTVTKAEAEPRPEMLVDTQEELIDAKAEMDFIIQPEEPVESTSEMHEELIQIEEKPVTKVEAEFEIQPEIPMQTETDLQPDTQVEAQFQYQPGTEVQIDIDQPETRVQTETQEVSNQAEFVIDTASEEIQLEGAEESLAEYRQDMEAEFHIQISEQTLETEDGYNIEELPPSPIPRSLSFGDAKAEFVIGTTDVEMTQEEAGEQIIIQSPVQQQDFAFEGPIEAVTDGLFFIKEAGPSEESLPGIVHTESAEGQFIIQAPESSTEDLRSRTDSDETIPKSAEAEFIIPRPISTSTASTGELSVEGIEADFQLIISEKATTDQVKPSEGIPPEFTSTLQPQICEEGDEVLITCVVVGYPVPEITWFRNEVAIRPSPDFRISFEVGTGTCTLNIAEIFPEDAGEFSCKGMNPFGHAVTTTTIIVEGKY